MVDGFCKVKGVSKVPDAFEINDGVSRLEGWPGDACCEMSPKFPKDIELADSIAGAKFIVISGRVKAALEAGGARNVEYLPLKIINHKGRVASEDYSLLNPLEVIDCIDKAASVVEEDTLNDGMIDGVQSLVLREEAIPEDMHLFRTKFWSGRILIRRRLADELTAAGFTGLNFIEPRDYTGMT